MPPPVNLATTGSSRADLRKHDAAAPVYATGTPRDRLESLLWRAFTGPIRSHGAATVALIFAVADEYAAAEAHRAVLAAAAADAAGPVVLAGTVHRDAARARTGCGVRITAAVPVTVIPSMITCRRNGCAKGTTR